MVGNIPAERQRRALLATLADSARDGWVKGPSSSQIMDSHHNSSHFENDTFWFIFNCNLELENNSRRVALFLLYLLLFGVGLAANCVVLWVNWRRRHSRSGVLFCLLNVTLSDLMVVLVLPFFMLETVMDKVWIWGAFLCKFTHFVYASNFYSSSFFLAYMTVERYMLVVHPNSRTESLWEKRHRALLSTGLWVFALFLALLENVHVVLLEWNEPGCYIMPENSYDEWFASIIAISLIFQFLCPAAVIIGCNVQVARTLASVRNTQGRCDKWLLHVYSIVFVLCWLPFHLVRVLMLVDIQDPFLFSCTIMEIIFFSHSVVECLSLFHCVANPILYNFLDQRFRKHLARTLVLTLSRQEGGGQANAAASLDGMGVDPASPRKEQELSNSSTSHSTVNP
ncbi:G-protein coupled receptor 182-like [Arapaima gigas]